MGTENCGALQVVTVMAEENRRKFGTLQGRLVMEMNEVGSDNKREKWAKKIKKRERYSTVVE